jgi:hypothetical protein
MTHTNAKRKTKTQGRGATRNPDLIGAAKVAHVSRQHAFACLEGKRQSLTFVESLEQAGHSLAKKAREAWETTQRKEEGGVA